MNRTFVDRKSEQGFTLVELAIVMIIIGLLIGGILKGQELIANARVASTVSQIKGIDAATSTFRDKYAAVPGDMANADKRLVNCTAAPCLAAAADNNGRVDSVTLNAAPAGENLAFWSQLSAADLINGIDPNGGAAWGGEFPEANVGGGFHVAYAGAVADIGQSQEPAASFRSGNYLALHNSPGGAVNATSVGLTPNQAFRIDNKLDDGVPTTGNVSAGPAACLDATGEYNETVDTESCLLYIRFQQ